jgi:hypothetical protein
MFRKMMFVFCAVFVGLNVLTLPVSAQGKGPNPPLPPQAHGPQIPGWKFDINVVDPYIFDPAYPDQYFWSFNFQIRIHPASWPVEVVILREGVLMTDYTWTYEEGATLLHGALNGAGPVWEIDPPDIITYTFVLTSQGQTISKDIVLFFD